MRRTSLVLLLTAPLLAGCLGLGPSAATRVYGPPEHVVRVAAGAFRAFDIPARSVSGSSTRIDSGEIRLQEHWGGDPVEVRVDCGTTDDDEPRAALGPIRLYVWLTAELRRTPAGRTDPNETIDYASSRIDLGSRGTLTMPDGKRHGCRLTREFARRILSEIAIRTGNGPMGPVGPRIPVVP